MEPVFVFTYGSVGGIGDPEPDFDNDFVTAVRFDGNTVVGLGIGADEMAFLFRSPRFLRELSHTSENYPDATQAQTDAEAVAHFLTGTYTYSWQGSGPVGEQRFQRALHKLGDPVSVSIADITFDGWDLTAEEQRHLQAVQHHYLGR